MGVYQSYYKLLLKSIIKNIIKLLLPNFFMEIPVEFAQMEIDFSHISGYLP